MAEGVTDRERKTRMNAALEAGKAQEKIEKLEEARAKKQAASLNKHHARMKVIAEETDKEIAEVESKLSKDALAILRGMRGEK